MKKFLTLMLGLTLFVGAATVTFGQDTKKEETTKKKKKKKKTDDTDKK